MTGMQQKQIIIVDKTNNDSFTTPEIITGIIVPLTVALIGCWHIFWRKKK